MSLSAVEYLRHILDETGYLTDQTQQLTKDQFLCDATLKRAFVRSLEIIGEASKQIPEDFRQKHCHLEWRAMAGMCDRLIHGYFGVDMTSFGMLSWTKYRHFTRQSGRSLKQRNFPGEKYRG